MAKALARLVEQFKTKSGVNSLVSAIVQPLQGVDDGLYQLLTERWIDDAAGENLDTLGAIVGQAREGRDDDTYRVWIRARSVANRSNGHADDTLQILDLITPTADYALEETPPAAYIVTAFDLGISADSLFQLLSLAKPAGVRLNLIYSEDTANTFTLSDVPNTTTTGDFSKGFGTTANPATGGQLAGVL